MKRFQSAGALGIAAAMAMLIFAFCRNDRPVSKDIAVFVTIPPQRFLLRRVGGNRVDVHALVEPGANPHSYAPSPQQMARLSEARLYFKIGIEMEQVLLPKIESAMKNIRIVDMQKGIPLRLIETPEMDSPAPASQAHGGHELEDAHLSGGTDPHTWMNPQNAKLQAAIARDALSSIDSGNAAYYAANYDKLAAELDSLDRELTRILEPVRDKEIFVYHPAFGYFADAYGLRQVSVEMGGKEPGARQLSRLIDLARKRNVKVIFVQPEYSDKSARALADQVGAIVVAIDALAEEYTANLRTIGRTIERALLRQH